MGELMVWLIIGAFLYAALTVLAPLILVAAAVGVALVLLSRIWHYYYDRNAAIRQNRKALVARADHQHRLIMAGDDIGGVYGDYLPPRGLR